jgi:hypothetical protein
LVGLVGCPIQINPSISPDARRFFPSFSRRF